MRTITITLLISFCWLLISPTAAQDTTAANFKTATCMFTVPQGQTPECGYLTVPENRSKANGQTIKLAVAVFRSDNPDKSSTPLIYLEGGPGGSALEFLSLTFKDRYADFLENQDVIIFDQRGVGRSQPALDCKELTNYQINALDRVLSTEEVIKETNLAAENCATRLAGTGIELAAYNSAESASDVNDLRIALGYDTLDLYGISYGTKLALTIMRDHPEAVRSSIIDSVYPPQVSINDAPRNFERSLKVLFKGCKVDTACNTAFPDLETVFYDTIAELNKTPASFEVLDPTNGRQRMARLDGDGFAGYIFQALYGTEIIPSLPKNIYDVHNGDTRFLGLWTLLTLAQLDVVSAGMNYAVQCTEEIPFDSRASIETTLSKLNPALNGFARRNGIEPSQIGLCTTWNPAKPNPIENEAVQSDIPTLVVSGEYDPITPPANGQLAAETLSNGYFFEFPATGHGVIATSECALGIAQAFLKDPSSKPDSACIAEMKGPVFITSDETTSAPIELEGFSNKSAGYTAVRPVGWTEAGAGIYGRGGSALDQTAIAYQSVPGGNVDLVIPLFASQFGLDTDQVVTREANGLEWRLLTGKLQGIPLNLAITEGKGKIYLILVLSTEEEQASLYDALFLPAVDGFKLTE